MLAQWEEKKRALELVAPKIQWDTVRCGCCLCGTLYSVGPALLIITLGVDTCYTFANRPSCCSRTTGKTSHRAS